jgi:DNA-directed RNA polymerase specialized sigma subunit
VKSNLTIEMYENAYRKAWEEMRVKERKDQREKRNSYQPTSAMADNFTKNKPVKDIEELEIKLELSEKAKKVNLLLQKGLTPKECGQVLGCSRQAVLQVKNRYGLPR